MNSQLTFRRGVPEDLKDLQDLFVDTVRSVCSVDYDESQIEAWVSGVENIRRWNKIILTQFVLIAQEADKIVGYATLDKSSYLDLLYVHKDYLRKGIANILYAEIEEEARRRGINEITSDVSITAKPFFESVGYKIIAKQTVVRQKVELINFKMKKDLAIKIVRVNDHIL